MNQKSQLKKESLADYQMGRVIGRGKYNPMKGGFGIVKVAKNKKTGKHYAIKMLSKSQIIKAHQVDHVYNEIYVHSIVESPFIAQFKGFTQDSFYLYLIQELVNGGELFTYLRQAEYLPTHQCRFYAANVVLCFQYLHHKNIIYRDLKPENLIIAGDGYLKLIDFGFAKVLNEGRTFTICGTPECIAPEIILNQGHGKAVDWWTLGILIYEMHTGIDLINDEDPMGIYKNILRGRINFPTLFEKQARSAKSLIKHLLTPDLSKRYGNLKEGVKDIKKHRWFDTFIWDDMLKKKLKSPYMPFVKSQGDTSNFEEYSESVSKPTSIEAKDDPFISW